MQWHHQASGLPKGMRSVGAWLKAVPLLLAAEGGKLLDDWNMEQLCEKLTLVQLRVFREGLEQRSDDRVAQLTLCQVSNIWQTCLRFPGLTRDPTPVVHMLPATLCAVPSAAKF